MVRTRPWGVPAWAYFPSNGRYITFRYAGSPLKLSN